MRYEDFRDKIQTELHRDSIGCTWVELRNRLKLPYDRPCPEWTKRLEGEIGLQRVPGEGRAMVWTLRCTSRQPLGSAVRTINPPAKRKVR